MRVAFLHSNHIVALAFLIPALVSCSSSDSLPGPQCTGSCDDEEVVESHRESNPPEATQTPAPDFEQNCIDHELGVAFTSLTPTTSDVQAIGIDTDPDYLVLTAGAATVDAGPAGVSSMVLYGTDAFPVLVDESNRVFGAASRLGSGKVLAFGHDNYITGTIKTGDAIKIIRNAIPWMSNKPAPIIGLESNLTTLAATLQAAGYQTLYVTPSQLGTVNVYINRGYTAYTDAEYTAIRNFVTNGGGLIVGAQAWSSSALVMNFSANRMLSGSGIVISKSGDVSAALDVVSATPRTPLLNASYALSKLHDLATGVANLSAADQGVAGTAVERAATVLPLTVQEFYNPVQTFINAAYPVILHYAPLTPATNIPGRVAVRLRYKYTQELPPNELGADKNAANFPSYALPQGTPRVSLTVPVDGTYAGRDSRYNLSGAGAAVWRSTGAYAAPGEVVTVTVPSVFVNSGAAVQIGGHSDLLWNKSSWLRFPAIVRSYPITSTQMTVANTFGGMVYITIPGGKTLGQASVTIDNVVRAPLYIHGQTTLNDWLTTVRNYPGQWGELVSDKMIVMVPSFNIRGEPDPVGLMNRWDLIMDSVADLASIPHQRVRPERYHTDIDISIGSMHSGYPIMAPTLEGSGLTGFTSLAKGWGYWHEVGHNHQWGPWTLPGTSESVVNWWSVYISETLFNLPRAKGHVSQIPEDRRTRTQTYVANGKKYATWGSDPWLPLEMYMQLQEWFGWQPFIQLNADYNALTPAQSPSTDQVRLDQWTLRFAQNVGKNLGPFFTTTWGLPVSQTILDQMALLASWPASMPPPGVEAEPNDACAQALPVNAPVLTGTHILSAKTDVDWFVLPAKAADVGKRVHAVTAAGTSTTNTVVEVYDGSCAALTSLGGPSPDTTVHENWFSTPMTQSGSVYVKVTYSQPATYTGNKYTLTVTYE